MLRVLLLAACLAGFAACGPPGVPPPVTLVTEVCAGPSPMDGVTHLRFRVTGEGMVKPLESVVSARAHALELPGVPAGRARVVEVRGYAGDPRSSGQLLSLGRTLPFDVPEVRPLETEHPVTRNVFLRRVEAFTPVNVAIAPDVCLRLSSPRAAHTATLLDDGRVLLAGGYSEAGRALATADLYDPATGLLHEGPPLAVFNALGEATPLPRAFHAASLLADGAVLLSGGEVEGAPLADALRFDPALGSHAFGLVALPTARSRHGAAVDGTGRVLLIGGVTTGGAEAALVDWFDPETARAQGAAASLPRIGGAVLAVESGQVAVAGGAVGVNVTELVQFFAFDPAADTVTPALVPNVMRQPRRAPAAASFGDGRFIVLGGYESTDEVFLDPLATSDVVVLGELPSVEPGPNVEPRGEACAVALPGGRVLVVGGRGIDPLEGTPRARATAEVLVPGEESVAVLGVEPLPVPRRRHTCTLLGDGTVLVTGGANEDAGSEQVLRDAYVFTPAPVD